MNELSSIIGECVENERFSIGRKKVLVTGSEILRKEIIKTNYGDLGMKNYYWLVTTEHLKDRLWFRDEEDFKVGMNQVAVLAATSSVQILAFILMSNHAHFVLSGTKEETTDFIICFKKRYSQYYSKKYSVKEFLRENKVDFKELHLNDESLERAIAYVQMNSVAANICLHPSGYPWGTGGVFFNEIKIKRRTLGELSYRENKRLIHSKIALPSNYLLDENDVVSPISYVKTKVVESIYKSAKRMNYFLQSSSKARLIKEAPSFKDQLIISAMQDLVVSLFRKKNFEDLTSVQKSEILKQLRYRFSSEPNQLSRISGMPFEEVCRMLEEF